MKKVYRNIVKGYHIGRLIEICQQNSKKYNETWYILGDSQMAANAKGRKGYEQYEALAYHPNGNVEVIPSN